jgi:predicted Zn-dependent protease
MLRKEIRSKVQQSKEMRKVLAVVDLQIYNQKQNFRDFSNIPPTKKVLALLEASNFYLFLQQNK